MVERLHGGAAVRAAAWLATLALAGACREGGGQTLSQAVQVLCVSDEEAGVADVNPAERQAAKSRWIDARLEHPEARAAFRRITELPPQERVAALDELVTRAKLERCDWRDRATAGVIPPDLALPELARTTAGVEPLGAAADLLTVVARPDQVVIDGTSIAASDGAKLRTLTAALLAGRSSGDAPPRARLILARDARYEQLVHLVQAMSSAGVRRFELVARRDGEPVAAPVEQPEAPPGAGDAAGARGVAIFVSMTVNDVTVFSVSGADRRPQDFKLVSGGRGVADITRAQEAVVEVQARHPDERSVILMFDPTTPMQRVAELVAAVRAKPDGQPLLPRVTLSAGFQ